MTSKDATSIDEQPSRFFEDYRPGTVVDLGSVLVIEGEVVAFARRYDPQPMHTDPDAARSGPYGGLIASGWHTCALVMQRFVPGYLSPASSLGSPGIDELRFRVPVRPGDTLRARASVLTARPSQSKPDRGVVHTRLEAVNDEGAVVLSMVVVNIILCRPLPGSAVSIPASSSTKRRGVAAQRRPGVPRAGRVD